MPVIKSARNRVAPPPPPPPPLSLSGGRGSPELPLCPSVPRLAGSSRFLDQRMDHSVMEGSCSKVKMASLEVQLESINSSRSDLSTYSSGAHEITANYMEGERNVLSETEDVDIQMHFCCCEGLSDDNECMWLSSGSTSTSFLSSDDLQTLDILETDFCDALLYDQSTMLPVLDVGNRSAILDGSAIDLIEESPVLIRMQDGVGEDLYDDGNKAKDSSKGSLESVESVHGRPCCDDLSSNSNGLWPSLGTHDEPSSSEDNDFDRTNIWVSLVDLDNEESEWDRDGFDDLDPDFPSPSYRILRNLRIRTSKGSFCPSSKQLLDVQASLGSPSFIIDLSLKHPLDVESSCKVSDADEPLFWPFDWKSYWRPEFEGNYLGISPRASILRIKRPRGRHAPKSARFGLHNKNGPSPQRENIQQGYRRRMLISSRSAGPTLAARKTRDLNNQVSHTGKVPSRLSRSTASSSDKSTSNLSKKGGKGRPQLKSGKKKRGRDQKSSVVQYLLEFEAGELQIYLGGVTPIEALVGLDEFDGHEGVGKMMRAS